MTPGAPAATRPPAFHALLERKDCAQLFVIFCGRAGRVMLDPLDFIKQTRIIDRNLLMLRDLNDCCYQRGVDRSVTDIPGLLDWLRGARGRLPHVRRLFCVGSSSGAYMALVAGHLLQAEGVWAFAPPGKLDEHSGLDHVDARFADPALLLSESNGVTRYHVYYNELHEPDRAACQRLAGAPGVQLHPQEGEGHGVVLHLARTNRLTNLLPAFEKS